MAFCEENSIESREMESFLPLIYVRGTVKSHRGTRFISDFRNSRLHDVGKNASNRKIKKAVTL